VINIGAILVRRRAGAAGHFSIQLRRGFNPPVAVAGAYRNW